MSDSSIYDQHRKHAGRVAASAILRNGEHVASITIIHPADGAGRLYAYAHWLGTRMVRGHAGGYGYDKRSAALASASRAHQKATVGAMLDPGAADFWAALDGDNGKDWADKLRDAGFTVCHIC